jgi:hypothetical protein
MTLLELVQNFCLEVGITSPTQVVTSQDTQILQVLAIINRFGHDLSREHDWQMLDKEYIFQTQSTSLTGTTVSGSPIITGISSTAGLSTSYGVDGTNIAPFSQIISVDGPTQVTMNMPATGSATSALTFGQVQYPLPSDWLKQMPTTEWDRSNRWPLLGPASAQDWQSFKSGIVYSGPRLRFRIQGNKFTINPPPSANTTLAFEYISSSFVLDADGVTYKNKFTADTDTCVYDDSLMITGLKLRWLQTKGFDYSYALVEYERYLAVNKSQENGSASTLSLAPMSGNILLSNRNLPDGNWVA